MLRPARITISRASSGARRYASGCLNTNRPVIVTKTTLREFAVDLWLARCYSYCGPCKSVQSAEPRLRFGSVRVSKQEQFRISSSSSRSL